MIQQILYIIQFYLLISSLPYLNFNFIVFIVVINNHSLYYVHQYFHYNHDFHLILNKIYI